MFGKFDYYNDKLGNYKVDGKINYKQLNKYQVIGLSVVDKFKIYIAKCKIYNRTNTSHYIEAKFMYRDILTNCIVCCGKIKWNSNTHEFIEMNCSDYSEILTEEEIEKYLIYFDFLKAEYSVSDIKSLLSQINENFEYPRTNEKVKKLVNLVKKDN